VKRDIRCKACADDLVRLVGNYPDEHVKVVKGIARKEYMCDGCFPAKMLLMGITVYAVSLWSDESTRRGMGYYEWEHEFIIEGGDDHEVIRKT